MEELFDKDITVINKYYDKIAKKTEYKASYVKGFWSADDSMSISGTHLIKNDKTIVRILINDSRNEAYQEPIEFKRNAKTWTLQNDDYLVKGIVEEFTTIANVLDSYRDVMKITNIETKDYGSEDMQHWAIMGE